MELLSKYLPKETKLSGIAESGTLTLVGKVSNAHAKEAAVDLANRTQGVSKVIDNLRIPYSVGDIDLANSVIFELGSNRDIKVYHLQVFAKSGHVFLSGNAGDKNSITLAESTAEKVSGVKSVSNGIRLHGEGENSDDLLTKKIEAEIKKSQDVRARDVKVTAIDGHVFLKGYAKNTTEIIAAETLVSKINGVKRLYMELEPRV
ncbi:MAG: BON domain-containing protein [Caldisericia bacterium]